MAMPAYPTPARAPGGAPSAILARTLRPSPPMPALSARLPRLSLSASGVERVAPNALGGTSSQTSALGSMRSTLRRPLSSVLRPPSSVLCLLILTLAVTGCGRRETEVERSNRTGVLHLSIGSEPTDLDPQVVTSMGEVRVIPALFEPLVSFDPVTLAPTPALAEAYAGRLAAYRALYPALKGVLP